MHGIRIAMRFAWRDCALRLARRITTAISTGTMVVTANERSPEGTWIYSASGRAAFLAAHVFLIWGNDSDAPFIAELMQVSFQNRVSSFNGGNSPGTYALSDMAAMAAAARAGESPEDSRHGTSR